MPLSILHSTMIVSLKSNLMKSENEKISYEQVKIKISCESKNEIYFKYLPANAIRGI